MFRKFSFLVPFLVLFVTASTPIKAQDKTPAKTDTPKVESLPPVPPDLYEKIRDDQVQQAQNAINMEGLRNQYQTLQDTNTKLAQEISDLGVQALKEVHLDPAKYRINYGSVDPTGKPHIVFEAIPEPPKPSAPTK